MCSGVVGYGAITRCLASVLGVMTDIRYSSHVCQVFCNMRMFPLDVIGGRSAQP